jgi:hypothetical protein
MAKKSKKTQDDQKPEEDVVEVPEDRLDQIRESLSDEEVAEDSQPESSTPRKQEPDQASEDASEEISEEPQLSGEDLLADVRQSLAEEEVEEEPKGFFGRIRKRLRKSRESKSGESETLAPPIESEAVEQKEEVEDLQGVLDDLVAEPKPKQKKKKSTRDREEEKAVQEFFADLEALADVELEGEAPPSPEGEEASEDETKPEEKVMVPRLPLKSEADEDVDLDAVRQVALEEYDETKVEIEEKKLPLREEVRQTIRELRPFERMLLIAFGVVTAVVLFSSGVFLIASTISISTPTPTAEFDPGEMVHPTKLTLPGGWEFALGQGRVVEGIWEPDGAEWLVGTEISRWVALPWSLQLEAVLRTLNSEDTIELTMSNLNEQTYNVYSIQEITMEELLATDQTTPSLLVVLYNDEEADGTFWTVTALP